MDPNVYLAIAVILVVLGVLGTVLPVLPGALLVFAGLFLAAWAQDFTRVGLWGLAIIGALMALSFAVDFIASMAGAKRVGASPKALVGAALGGLAGLFFGLPGILLGPFIGAVLGELIARGGFAQAARVGVGTWLGLLVAAVAKLVIAFLMIGTFAAFYVANS
ncbi:MAG TPA: DUF456 domain-containing protein [Usitatibacter sp.]|jgi:uncharacterized protein YqgC (DUF456 family)|nr:DUF456 domain-containing protein [Usitatibacter sp.]